jgi:phosphohistidine phosphatase
VAPGRTLWVLRHAKTRREPPRGGGDHERELTSRGRRDADALGARLADDGDHLGLGDGFLPDLVLCSTAVRAAATAERVLARMAEPPVVSYLSSLYEASPEEVLELVAGTGDDVGSLMIVGHNPTFEVLVAGLPRVADPALSGGFATCALAVLSFPVSGWAGVAPETADVLGVFVPPF